MNTNLRNKSGKVVSIFLFLAIIMTLIIQIPTKAYASSSLELEMYNVDKSTSVNTIKPNIRLTNTGTEAINLSTVKIKYYYTKDQNLTQVFSCDYSSAGTDNVTGTFYNMPTATSTADTYVEIGFTAGTINAGSSIEMQTRIYNASWGNYTQTNDYSFNGTDSSYANWNNVTAYIGDTLYCGTEPITTTDPDPTKKKFLVIVASSLYNSITTNLNTYVDDVYGDGYNATIIKVSNNSSDQSADYVCATAPALKNVIKSYYNQGYVGFVLIGSYPEFPVVKWTSYIGNNNYSISDNYFADVDLNNDGIAEMTEDWIDANNDGIFEVSSVNNEVRTPQNSKPEMFYGRIDAGGKSSTVAGQAQVINNYLTKLHNFRNNRSTISTQKKSALGFIDDDWRIYYETDAKLRSTFDNVKMIQDKYATNTTTLNSEFSNQYYFMDIITHGAPDLLQLSDWMDNALVTDTSNLIYRTTIEGMGPSNPKAYYIHSFGCGTSRYAEPTSGNPNNIENLGASYLFDNENTVNVTGVCGSIWNNLSADYFKNLCSMSIGEAYKLWLGEWYDRHTSYPMNDDVPSWEAVPDYMLLGDPTLKHPLQDKTNSSPYFSNIFDSLIANMGDEFSLSVYPVDPDSDAVTVTMLEAPTGATFNSTTNTINWTPVLSQAYGAGQKFVLKITDTAANTYTEEFNVYVDVP